jgi:hypothetical protein
MHKPSRPAPATIGPLALMALTRSGVSPRLLAALAQGRAAPSPARRALHPVAPNDDTDPSLV